MRGFGVQSGKMFMRLFWELVCFLLIFVHKNNTTMNRAAKLILWTVGAMFILQSCQKEKREYVYNVSASLYTCLKEKNTVKDLGPKDVVIKTSRDPLDEINLVELYTNLAGHTWSQSIFMDNSETSIPYNRFTFGYLHIVYHDSDKYDSLSKFRETVDYFLQPYSGGVIFWDHRPNDYDERALNEVVESAVPE